MYKTLWIFLFLLVNLSAPELSPAQEQDTPSLNLEKRESEAPEQAPEMPAQNNTQNPITEANPGGLFTPEDPSVLDLLEAKPEAKQSGDKEATNTTSDSFFLTPPENTAAQELPAQENPSNSAPAKAIEADETQPQEETKDSIQNDLKNILKDSEESEGVSLENVNQDSLKILISDDILFRKSEVSLKESSIPLLEKIAQLMKKYSNYDFFVIGHADSSPIVGKQLKKFYPTNWEFSVMRSVMVVRYLTELLGVNPSILTAAGRSFYHPIDSGKTEAAKSKNRRTEIWVFPRLEEKTLEMS